MSTDTSPVGSPAERANARNAFIAGFLGWTLDAFDYFILTYVLAQVGADFHRSVVDMAATITVSLMVRPIGALIFGLMADRYGRRLPLMLDVLFYSLVEVLCGFARTYRTFFMLRVLYGMAMGGEWGVGASLAMESIPAKWRGILSGLLQEGYALGNLLAALAFWWIFPHWGWRAMFFMGGLPALLVLYIRAKVKESEAWKAEVAARASWRAYLGAVVANWKRFLYLVLLVSALAFISHGTQDLYPTFLQQQRRFSTEVTAMINVLSMVGAIVGGLLVGWYSDRHGRRRAMVTAAVLGVLLIPMWVFAPTMASIAVGAFGMQFMVQGAWGVVPAHTTELSPGPLRGFFPGLAYQLGVLIAAGSATVEAALTRHFTYAQAMGGFAAISLVVGAIVIAAGPEAHRVRFGRAP
ncbi:MAG TPA: MFS transporter [Candidatus Acidoferrales bacterium]|nr:MFS transporter [Candidatus Acidoferrales bacterium]